jgi:hypothetical protein
MKKLVGLILFAVFVTGCATIDKNIPDVSEVDWPDYQKPLAQEMRVFQYKQHKIQSATIIVNLPEEFLNKHEEIILIVDAESKTQGGFKVFLPFLRINRSSFQTAKIPMEDLPYRQTVEVKIKRKHLNAGQNTLQASFRWNGDYYCSGFGCGYVIHEISFKEAS